MNKDPKISHIQLRGLIVSSIIGVGVLSMQNALATAMGTDGWIAIIISGLLMVPVLAIYTQIFKLYPDKDFYQIGKATLGSILFTLCLIIFLVYLIMLMAIVSRNLGELIKIFLLQTTPLEVLIITFILASTYISSYEIDVIAGAAYFVYPIIILFAALIVLISLPKADFTNILPVFRTDFPSILKGVGASSFSFTGLEFIIFGIPFVEEKDKVFKSGLLGIMTVTIIYVVMFIMTLTHFSIEQIQSTNYPVLVLVRQLDLPGFFLENLDGVIMALWVLVVFATMIPAYYGAGKILSKIFKTKSHKYFILGLVPIIYYVAMIPDNFIELSGVMNRYFNMLSIIIVIVMPLLMLIVGYIRKKVIK